MEVGRFSDAHAQRFTHRLETFFDIVLGLSLGMMSLNLALPHHAINVYTQPFALAAFAFTFLVVSILWYSHNRLFEYFFVPTPLTIALNFVTLALVVWLVYQLQVFVHFQGTVEETVAAASYIVTFSAVWLLLMALYLICMRIRWNEIGTDEQRIGVMSVARLGSIGFGSLVTLGLADRLGWPSVVVFASIFVWAALGRIIGTIVIRRTL
ncbi:MAG: TMEM175 family protein [Candidatus Tumulicola sp.]